MTVKTPLAICCSVLQCVLHCVLQCVLQCAFERVSPLSVLCNDMKGHFCGVRGVGFTKPCCELQWVAVYICLRLVVSVCISLLQFAFAVWCSVLQLHWLCIAVCCSWLLLCGAVCCSLPLLCGAVCCSLPLLCGAACCSLLLLCGAVCCSLPLPPPCCITRSKLPTTKTKWYRQRERERQRETEREREFLRLAALPQPPHLRSCFVAELAL